MRIKKVKYDRDSPGITEGSLRMLRNTLAEKIRDEICVIEIPTNDLCCGYLILDQANSEAVYTGDGFRPDRGGEGGAGFNSAAAIFRIYGIELIHAERTVILDPLFHMEGKEAAEFLIVSMQKLVDEIFFMKVDFTRPIDNRAGYVNGTLYFTQEKER